MPLRTPRSEISEMVCGALKNFRSLGRVAGRGEVGGNRSLLGLERLDPLPQDAAIFHQLREQRPLRYFSRRSG